MPEIIIVGTAYPYDPEVDKTLLPFATKVGVEIPYFCYHPAMSAPTNCRMCLVDVGMPMRDRATGEPVLEEDGTQKIMWGRKPSTSCNQGLTPGMVVKTNRTSPAIDKAQKGVLEFMLINHPLDCPICDQAGECPLQIQTYKYGPEGSRFELEKVHKPKRIELGPRVTLDAERCINCTRCTRFTDEISGSRQLSIVNRGEKNHPAAAPGQVFNDPYSMNTIDLCPVGALTSTAHRFKARAWEMNYTPSVCTGCAKNCSVDVWVRDNEVMRLTPRHNAKVNDYWMCDHGRLDLQKYNKMRLSGVKNAGDVPADWESSYYTAADWLKRYQGGEALFMASGRSSLETLHALKALADATGSDIAGYVPETDETFGDDFLRQNDRLPNAKACELVGIPAKSKDEILHQLESGAYQAVYVVEDSALAKEVVAKHSGKTIVLAWHYDEALEPADLLFASAMEIEARGTFIGADGQPQVTDQSRQVKQMTPEDWMAMSKSRLDAAGQLTDRWRKIEHIYDVVPAWRILERLRALLAQEAPQESFSAYFQQVKAAYPDALAAVSLRTKNAKRSFKHSQFEFALDLRAGTHKV